MDNNDSNIKSQQTGGLKLMTVFIAVLALHVVVIGGFTVYHLMSGGSADADLVTLDKTHKNLKADGSATADATTPDASLGEKGAPSAPTATPPIDVTSIPANPSAPAVDITAPSEMVAPAPGPAPVLTPAPAPALTAATAMPKPLTLTPSTEVADKGTLAPAVSIPSELAPPPEPAPAPTTPAPAPSAPVASGPVHMPPAASSPVAPKIEREHGQAAYVVKITDSYKKIAHAHHITVAQLKEANHIKGDVLHTGQKLVIPSEKTLVATNATTTALDSAPSGPILNESASASTAILTSAPSTAATTASHQHFYTVVKGDTLIKIAHKFKTTASAIMTENNISDPAKLTIGKKLKIPSRESRSARNSVPASTQPIQVQAKEKENAPSAELANFVP